MSKKLPASPHRESQPLSAADIRDIIKDELTAFRASVVEEVVERLKPSHRDATHDPFNLEAPMPSGEREAYAPVLDGFSLRREAGMSKDLAEVMSKIERGIDPTPLEFNFPSGASYFGKEQDPDDPMKTRPKPFELHFVELVKAGKTTVDAYRETCSHFGKESHEKRDPRTRIIGELPTVATGAFALGRAEAASRFGIGLLTEGDDDKDK